MTIISGTMPRQTSMAFEVRNPELESEILNSRDASAYPSLTPITGKDRNTALRSFTRMSYQQLLLEPEGENGALT